jgi:hypothetical protein
MWPLGPVAPPGSENASAVGRAAGMWPLGPVAPPGSENASAVGRAAGMWPRGPADPPGIGVYRAGSPGPGLFLAVQPAKQECAIKCAVGAPRGAGKAAAAVPVTDRQPRGHVPALLRAAVRGRGLRIRESNQISLIKLLRRSALIGLNRKARGAPFQRASPRRSILSRRRPCAILFRQTQIYRRTFG